MDGFAKKLEDRIRELFLGGVVAIVRHVRRLRAASSISDVVAAIAKRRDIPPPEAPRPLRRQFPKPVF